MSSEQLQRSFIGWQCLLRQDAMRQQDGRPTKGMCPEVVFQGDPIQHIVVLLVPEDLKELVQEFRFMHSKTEDPAIRRENVMRIMAASFFQQPDEFSGLMTALFHAESDFVKRVVDSDVVLRFEQYGQHYHLPCAVKHLHKDQDAYQFTYWHNLFFNIHLPQNVCVLAFTPDWHGTG